VILLLGHEGHLDVRGHDVHRAASVDELTHALHTHPFAVEAVVIGPDVPRPERAVQRVHASDRDVAVVVLGDADQRETITRTLQFTPFIGRDVQWSDRHDPALSTTVVQAAARTRARRRHQLTIARATRGVLPAAPPAPEQFLDHLLDATPVGVVVTDEHGVITNWNAEAERLLLRAVPSLRGASLQVTLGGDPEQITAKLNEAREGAADVQIERRVAGRRQYLNVTMRTVPATHGKSSVLAVVEDVTERQETLATVRRQAELLELAYDPVIVWTLGGGITFWNRAAQDLYGYTRDEALGSVVYELLRTDAMTGADTTEREDTLRRTGAWRGRLRHTTRDGRVVIVDSRQQLVPGDAPGEFQVLAANRDVTDQVRAEEELRERETYFRRLVDANPIGVVIGNDDGEVTYVNDAYLRLLRLTRDAFERGEVNWVDLTPPEWRHTDERAIRQAREHGYSDPYEKEYRLPGGDRVPVLLAVTRGTAATGGLVAYVLDLTDRKALERTLSDQNAELQALNRQILESAGDGILGADRDGRVAFANPAALAALHAPWDALRGTPLRAVLANPDGSDTLPAEPESLAEQAARSGGTRRADNQEFVRADGSRFPAEYTVTPMRDVDGRVTGAVMTFRDITARKEAEAALLRSNEELTRSNRDLEQFAYVASHDLQEPLRTIASFAELLARKYAGQLDEQGARYLDIITDGAKRLKTLVQDLLVFSRTRGEFLRVTDVNADDIMREVTLDLQDTLTHFRATVTWDPLPVVRADPGQLKQLLQNLVSNGVKFHRDGLAPTVHVSCDRDDERWHFRVADNGIGIDPRYFEKIFMVFQRLHAREQYQGTGIGLAICRQVVERHGGDLWVDSTPGAGSVFHFTLPDSVPDAPSQEAPMREAGQTT